LSVTSKEVRIIRIAAYPKCFEYEIGLHGTMTVFEWIRMAKRGLDVEGLEMYERFLPDTSPAAVQRVREAVTEAGFVVPMFIASPDFTDPDPDARQRAIDHQIEMIQVASWLGGKSVVCRVLSGQARPGVSRAQGVAWVVEAIQRLLPVARELDVILGMENHYKDSQWTRPEFALHADVFMDIVNAVRDRDHFGVQYDPSNALIAGEDPLALLRMVVDRVVSMHASDRHWKPGVSQAEIQRARDASAQGYASLMTHGVVGEGLNDYDAIFSLLSDHGYDSWVSIEDGVNGLEEIQQSVAFLKRMRATYWTK
jgi:sugar phosphate isomerase/epimerase